MTAPPLQQSIVERDPAPDNVIALPTKLHVELLWERHRSNQLEICRNPLLLEDSNFMAEADAASRDFQKTFAKMRRAG
jgi:hypothetical protein